MPIGEYSGHANAFITEGTEVDAQNSLTVKAEALNTINEWELWGANLVDPFRDENHTADYKSADHSPTLNKDDTVEVSDGHTAGGEIGATYRYIGPDGAETTLATEDFTNSRNWQPVKPGLESGLTFIAKFNTYLDANLGVDDWLIDSWTQAVAVGQENLGIGLAVNYLNLDFDANALIQNGAKINQDLDLRNDNQTVTVEANTENVLIALGGNFKSPGMSGSKSWTTPFGTGNEGDQATAKAIGAAFLAVDYLNNATAKIDDNVILYADSLEVEANTNLLAVVIGASAGGGKTLGFNGVVVVNSITNTTLAQVHDGATVTVGDNALDDPETSAAVAALDESILVNIAGGYATSEKIGVGGSVATNSVNRTTEAVIGKRESETRPVSSTGSFSASGDVSIKALNSGFIGSFGVAGAKASNKTASPEAVTQNKTALGLSVGVGFNKVTDKVLAYVAHQNFTPTGNVNLTATNDTTLEAFSIGGSYSSGNANSIALAGAGSSNEVDSIVETFIQNSTITTAGAVSLKASDKSGIFAHAGSFAIANTSSTDSTSATSLSIGLSVAINKVGGGSDGHKVRSYIDNSNVTAGGGVSLTAESPLDLHALAIGGSVSSARGQAKINSLQAPAGAGSNSTLAGAAAGAYAENIVTLDIQSYISSRGSSQIDTTGGSGAVTLTTNSETTLIRADAFGVAAAYASGGVQTSGGLAIGAGLAFNTLTGTSKAHVASSTVNSGGPVTIAANSKPHINALAIGIAASIARGTGTTGALAGAGSVAKNVVDNKIEAHISNSGTAETPGVTGTGLVSDG